MRQAGSKFLLGFGVSALCFCAAVVATNVIIDPFMFWRLVTIPGINSQRPEFSSWPRMAKAQLMCRLQPSSVIMGSSRPEVGLDPRYPAWRQFPGRTYNLAMAGAGLGELDLTLRHAKYASPRLRQVVMALDFFMFNANREAVVFGTEVLDFDRGRLLTSPSDSCLRTFLHDSSKLLWIHGIPFDVETVRKQLPDAARLDPTSITAADKWTLLYDRDGFRGNNYEVLIAFARHDGFRSLVDSPGGVAGQEAYYVSKIWRPPPDQRFCFTRPGQPDTIAVFRDIVQFARQSGIDIRFVINPIHARMLIALQESGLWLQYEDWKRGLVSVLAEEAKQDHAKPFPLWDFSGFNSITTEPIPPFGDKQHVMRWWWEPSHYQKATGDLILDRVLDYKPDLANVPPDFGIILSPSNVGSWLAKTLERGREYRRDQPGEVAIVSNRVLPLIADAEGTNCGYDIEALRAGSTALQHGDRAVANADFARAVAIHDADQRRAEAEGVPDREAAFPKLLSDAEAGKALPVELASWEAYQARGNARAAKADWTGAIADYTRAIELSPPNTALFYLRGTARLQIKNYLGALEDFRAGLALEPMNTTLRQLKEQASAALADEGAKRPTTVDPEAAAKLQQEGDAAMVKGDLMMAIRAYDRAIQVSPPNTALYYLRGTAYLQAGEYAAAAEDFRAGLKLEPVNPALQHLLEEAKLGMAKHT
ncbi:MAG TPA: tetratricopeptide repeat protein [Tepidisphaeraceae bacterium]|nr:tetratricopeptide repeat protein [Tepidisphaeraceae bacterium]